MRDNILYYSIGPLLYCPANKPGIAESVINQKFGTNFSLALCLEDTINDNFVAEAENDLIHSIGMIYTAFQKKSFYLPKLFIRVRNPEQINRLMSALKDYIDMVTGFIIPKFSLENARDYINAIIHANETAAKKIYFMPIYESASIIHLQTRYDILYSLKDCLHEVEELVLNIRVGGNDLCHIFGFRRHPVESIHRIKPISSIFTDIVTVYGADYVISAPVWEYYAGPGWKDGLAQEIQDDKLCGFTGKTVIHPNQIEVVNSLYKVSKTDFNDAKSILNWNKNANSFVSGSQNCERMNEYKTHLNWAKQTLLLAEAYGIQEDTSIKPFHKFVTLKNG